MDPPLNWGSAPMVGRPIERSPFIICKTPITTGTDWNIPIDQLFTVSMFLRYQQSKQQSIGLIIDLTDGLFYSGRTEIEKYNSIHSLANNTSNSSKSIPVSYVNIPINDSFNITTVQQELFQRVCSNFSTAHPNALIAVHDIYGYNTAGYMIGCYLCDINGLDIPLAYQLISISRPPGIYNTQLLQSFYNRYNESIEFDLAIIQPPEWDTNPQNTNYTNSGRVITNNNNNNSSASNNTSSIKSSSTAAATIPAPAPAEVKIKRKIKKPADTAAVPTTVTTPAPAAAPASAVIDSISTSTNDIDSSDPYASVLADTLASQSNTTIKRKQPSTTTTTTAHSNTAISTLSDDSAAKSQKSQSAASAINESKNSTDTNQSLSELTGIIKSHPYLIAVKPPHLARLQNILIQLSIGGDPTITNKYTTVTDIELGISTAFQYLNRSEIINYQQLQQISNNSHNYTVTWLPSGTTALLLILREGCFLAFRNNTIYHIPGLYFPTTNNSINTANNNNNSNNSISSNSSSSNNRISNSLLTGELLFDNTDTGPIARYLINDIINYQNNLIIARDTVNQRLQLAEIELSVARAQLPAIEKSKSKLHIRAKKLFPLSKVTTVLSMPLPHQLNGIIIIPIQPVKQPELIDYTSYIWNKNNDTTVNEANLIQTLKQSNPYS